MAEELTYGVDIDTANKTKKAMADSLKTTEKRVMNTVGAFASLYDFQFPGLKDPVLVMKTEEPGSKQLLAFQHDRIEGICQDMINHLINDCIVMGAQPLMVQDAVICGKLEKDKVTRLVKGMAEACKAQECVLTGGETSEQPGVIPAGTYILTSSIVGLVEKARIIDGSKIKAGDVVLSAASSGPHTNGYTLIRELLARKPELSGQKTDGRTFLDLVLEPHRCYYKGLKDLFPTGKLKGLAHITGGGIRENLDRILPSHLDAQIDLSTYPILPVFDVIKKEGSVADEVMLRTFNLGVGLAVVVSPSDEVEVLAHLNGQGWEAKRIGEIVAGGSGEVQVHGKLPWKA